MIFIDQMKREIRLETTPQRIVSLVPSQTELLYHLGLQERVVGITKFCIYPKDWHKNKVRIGGTKKVDFNAIEVLKPDLIIGNKEENAESDIQQLSKKYNVWMSDIYTLKDAFEMMQSLGKITDKRTVTNLLINTISENFAHLKKANNTKKALYFIWQNPFMLAGQNTFIHEMLRKIGIQNAVSAERYPVLEERELKELHPDYVFLSSEPYPFAEKHKTHFQKLFPKSKIVLVDGEFFSWYGSRLKNAPKYFEELLQLI